MPVSASRTRNSKNPKPKGVLVSDPTSRTQRALAAERSRKTKKATALEKEALFFETHYPKLNITQFGTRNAKQYAKFRESAQKRNKAKLNSLKEKLKGNLANMAQSINKLNKQSNNTNNKTNLEDLAKESLNEFLKILAEVKIEYTAPITNELGRLLWNKIDIDELDSLMWKKIVGTYTRQQENDNSSHTILRKFIVFYIEVREEYGDVTCIDLRRLMWKKISELYL